MYCRPSSGPVREQGAGKEQAEGSGTVRGNGSEGSRSPFAAGQNYGSPVSYGNTVEPDIQEGRRMVQRRAPRFGWIGSYHPDCHHLHSHANTATKRRNSELELG